MKITQDTPLGLVGLGNMGMGVAENLLKNGFQLTVHERSEKVRRWSQGRDGVTLTPSLRELGARSKVVLILVTDNAALDDVLFASDGVVSGIRLGSLVLDMTTGDPAIAVKNHRKLASRGIRMLEAPMTGGAVGAREGTLLLMVGGDRRLCQDCHPLFLAIARKVVYAGGPGKGQTIKLLQNQLSFTLFLATCEALWAGTSLGFEESTLIDVFQNSNARSYETELRFPRFVLSKSFQSGAAIRTAYKDLKLITDLEAHLNIQLPLAIQVRKYWEAAMARIGGEADFTRVYELVKNQEQLAALGRLWKKSSQSSAKKRKAKPG
jgi:3-hydroxyisobutyrate dehydrogenase-like beta-hydroxyacid dehydrogenase